MSNEQEKETTGTLWERENSPSERTREIIRELHKPIEVKVPDIITIDSKGRVTTIFSKLLRKLRRK